MIGATIGTHAYAQSELPLCFIGRRACIILGPKSLAGLRAYPVGPPKLIPIAQTKNPTKSPPSIPIFPDASAPLESVKATAVFFAFPIPNTPKTNIAVASISVTQFQK